MEMDTVVSISLKLAVVCVNCEEITRGRGNRCEVCGSTSLLSLPNIMNRTSSVPPSKSQHIFAREGTA